MRQFETAFRRTIGSIALLLMAVATWAMIADRAFCATVPVEVTSPSGLRIFLVEDHSAPLFTLGFRFAGGASQDPAGKEGLAHMTAEAFLQGAGSQPLEDYLKAWSELGAEPVVEARFESLRGTLKVLSKDRDAAAGLLAAAVNQPSLAPETLEDIRDQALAAIDRDAADPEAIAYAAYGQIAYPKHGLAQSIGGTRKAVRSIAAADIALYRRHVLARDGLTLAAVGDITPGEIGALADRIFANLPAHGDVTQLATPAMPNARRSDLPSQTSEAEVVFGVSLGRLTPRQQSMAELLNYTLGGSAFTSRLYHQIRDRRGLVYAIGSTLDNYSPVSEITGSFGAEPANVEEAIGLLRGEFERLAANGPSDAEVEEAKAALAGQYLRGLIRQTDLANELTLRMSQGFGADYIATYAIRLDTIAPGEVRDFARAVPWLDRLIVVTVGERSTLDDGTEGVAAERSRLHQQAPQEP